MMTNVLYSVLAINLIILIIIALFVCIYCKRNVSSSGNGFVSVILDTIPSFFKSNQCSNKVLGSKVCYRISDKLEYRNKSITTYQCFNDLSSKWSLQMTNNFNECTILMFESLNNVDELLKVIKFPPCIRYVFGVGGSDMMASKSALYFVLSENSLYNIVPKTYIVENGKDLELFRKDRSLEYNNTNMYILKKNVQRQEGFLITRDVDEVIDKFQNPNKGYVVCQELLQNPLVIGGRKINIRIYLLVICTNNSCCNMYMYDDGFMYYTKKMWVTNSTDPEVNITTGYIDRSVYVDNPLTFKDLQTKLNNGTNGTNGENGLGDLLLYNIKLVMTDVARAYSPIICSQNKNLPGTKFQIYGVDIAPSNDFKVQIMEINKGPDLGYKDERDKALKLGMVDDALSIVFNENLNVLESNFIKLV